MFSPKRLVSVFSAHLSNSEADEIRSVNAANPFVFMYVFSIFKASKVTGEVIHTGKDKRRYLNSF